MRQTRMFFLFGMILLFSLGCPKDSSPRLFMAAPKASSYSESYIKNLMHLGSHIIDKGVSFNLYSENATRIELLLFDDPESPSPSQIFLMSRLGNVWSIYIEGIGKGTYYGYRAWGPNWTYDPAWRPGSLAGFISDGDDNGNRFNPNKVLMDPYGRAYHRDHDWFKASAGTGPFRAESTVAASAKSIVVKDGDYQWSAAEQAYWTARQNGTLVGHNQEDLIIYEVNLKGFTKNLGGEVQHPGTFRGAGEYASYLKELGVTAVEFLPIQEAGADGGYWKYWTTGFFAPEVEYAYRPEKGSQINEFKWMVEQFHAQGIEVIIDVVFNHTGEGGLWRQRIPKEHVYDPDHVLDPHYSSAAFDPVETATIYSFRGIDNRAYYTLSQGQMQSYYEKNGVGNMFRANHTPGRKLIIDSLRYWVEEMHVDGFRFDLAPNLGYGDQTGGFSDSNLTWSATNTVIQDIADDPILKKCKTRIIAEPWDLGGYYVGQFSVAADFTTSKYGWAEWNGAFRDYMRAFINKDDTKLNSVVWGESFGNYYTGNSWRFGESGDPRAPLHSINFITAHDGYTLYDFLSYSSRRNVGAPLNPDGIDPDSGDAGIDGKDWSPPGENEQLKRQMYRNLVILLFLSQGTPMMLGGDEWMRTQFGNTNPYHVGADNTYNWFRWNYWEHSDIAISRNARWRMFDFYKKVIAYRKSHKYAFAPTSYTEGGDSFTWQNPTGSSIGPDWSGKTIAIYYNNVGTNKRLYLAVNMEGGDIDFTLPAGITWELRIDTQAAWDPDSSTNQTTGNFGDAGSPVNGTVVTGGNTYGVKARSICVFEKQ